MNFRSYHVISAAALFFCAIDAFAGSWKYGCTGSTGDTAIIFDRETLLLMPQELAQGNVEGIIGAGISAYVAENVNSGFTPTLNFKYAASQEIGLSLKETMSETISEETVDRGTREETTTIYQKTYHISGSSFLQDRNIQMKCLEYVLTTPG